MNSTAVVTNWYGMQKRAEEKLARAQKQWDAADFAYKQAEAELERVKRERRAAEGK